MQPKLSRFRPRRLAASAGVLALAIAVLAVPALASSSTWHGALDKSATTKLSFSYSGSHITKFTIPIILCTTGLNGVQSEMIYVPSIAVSGGRFSITYHVLKNNPKVIVKVSGTISGSRAVGTVTGSGACDTDTQPFHANLGVFKPVATTKPKAGGCTMASCLASNGMLIKVTAVDRTIRSVPDPPCNCVALPADPAFQKGGVGVTITLTDRSANGPVFVAPASEFQLRLGSGVLVQGPGPGSGIVSGSGAKYTCANVGSADQATLTRGASYGPKSVCFGAPTSADRQHLILYYMPGGSNVLAKIPLG